MVLSGLWKAYNSNSADWVATQFFYIRTFILRLLAWVLNLFHILLQVAGLQFGELYPLVQMYIIYLIGPILAPIFFFHDAAQDLDRTGLSAAQKENARIYASLPIASDATSGLVSSTSIIRLLEVHAGRANQPVFCTLKVANLSRADTYSYEALSYYWGHIDTSEIIYINQEGFRVSTTLFRAICHLRTGDNPRTVWIDAICINQDNLVERSSQVLLMPQIYSKATSVIVWLGTSPRYLGRTLLDVRETSRDTNPHAVNQHAIHYGATRIISRLLSRPWWKRVWVVQELVLAKKAILCCESDEIAWEDFCSIVDQCVSMPYFPTTASDYEDFRELRVLREERLSTRHSPFRGAAPSPRRLEPQSTHSYDLLTMIYNFRAREATNPLDKVFAFQGLAGETNSMSRNTTDPQSINRMLVYPDYTRRESCLSIDLAKAHIQTTRTLSIIALAEFARQVTPHKPDNMNWEKYIPSWCPAFMNEGVQRRLHLRPFWSGLAQSDDPDFTASDRTIVRDSVFSSKHFLSGPDDDLWASNHGFFYKLPIHILPHLSLTIKSVGQRASTVALKLNNMTRLVLRRQGSTITPFFSSYSAWESVLPSWRELALQEYRGQTTGTNNQADSKKLIPSRESFEELFNLTITGGKFAYVPPTSVLDIEGERGNAGVSTADAQAAPSSNQFSRLQLYESARADACFGRRFFITDSGHMGLGPADLEVGDEVHIILGLQVPAVLRKASKDLYKGREYIGAEDNDWVYVGQAYVHELMMYKGALEIEIQTGKVQLQELLLV
ncbi:heterokaryon incompatibility protein-domain-containing protein [Xylaria sp. FL1777]|nr:heterokaryon incompatibility protein-domain-containing protein [Xylaria sp. FL1777]